MNKEKLENLLSEGDRVEVDTSDSDFKNFSDTTEGVITKKAKNGCYIRFREFSTEKAVYWDEIKFIKKFYCEEHGRKIYHDKQESWICPFC